MPVSVAVYTAPETKLTAVAVTKIGEVFGVRDMAVPIGDAPASNSTPSLAEQRLRQQPRRSASRHKRHLGGHFGSWVSAEPNRDPRPRSDEQNEFFYLSSLSHPFKADPPRRGSSRVKRR